MRGKYSLLMGHGKAVEGSGMKGKYLWLETTNWPLWEERLIYKHYIHHCAGEYLKMASELFESCRYIRGARSRSSYSDRRRNQKVFKRIV
jgi:hypothetical protein